MRWIDGHLDLAYLALGGRDLRAPCADPSQGCISLPELREAGVETAFATIFTEPGVEQGGHPCGYPGSDDLDAAEAAGRRQVEFYEQLESEGELSVVRRREDLARPAALPNVVLLMEGADPIRGPEQVASWFEAGVRIVGLTWAAGTRYAGGNRAPGPLSARGVELVRALDEAGIVHDASHLADEAFDGLLESARPDASIVATHSNCRALAGNDPRHLRDDQIRVIGKRGGVVGLNLFSRFLVRRGRARVADCVRHVEHVCTVMGHRLGVALGSDADGGFGPGDLPAGLDHPRTWGALAEALSAAGWTGDEIAGFRRANWHRFLERALPDP